ncbi:MAG TPA: plastocyanin/azurin family copper-binding protein [Candidatus Limnocylindrales bacterium]|nr:plastocyanin/azurin family copper-binding protein [Candidatus Limnocylindrales bacterium]
MAMHRTTRRADRHVALVAASIVGLLLLGIGSVNAATVTVAAVNFEFQPASRSVKVGDVVRWTFAGDPHTVTSGAPGAPDGRFDSGIKDAGGSFQVTFDAAGTYRYFCQIHPEQMVGTIVVSAGSSATPKPTAKPTPKPTAKPTARPTARPTVKPTVAPTQVPTATPTRPPTPSPTAAEPAAPSSEPPTASPTGSAIASDAGGAHSPPPSAEPGPGESAAGVDPMPIVAGLVVLGLVVAGGLALARRPRRAG